MGFQELDEAGYHTIEYAVIKLLKEAENEEFHLTPVNFCKYMKGSHPKDKTASVTLLERKRYKKQLKNVLKYFNSSETNSCDWRVRASTGKNFKLIFTRK